MFSCPLCDQKYIRKGVLPVNPLKTLGLVFSNRLIVLVKQLSAENINALDNNATRYYNIPMAAFCFDPSALGTAWDNCPLGCLFLDEKNWYSPSVPTLILKDNFQTFGRRHAKI